jgi:hypothetical protein
MPSVDKVFLFGAVALLLAAIVYPFIKRKK